MQNVNRKTCVIHLGKEMLVSPVIVMTISFGRKAETKIMSWNARLHKKKYMGVCSWDTRHTSTIIIMFPSTAVR
ncbi:hypothetical protein XELAEV_18018830mg [Xenopus laevis]|uniref:Uncharacterized protein n=1 Tax=Xenopus laevis TaxID=8355 RepID=A0A974DEA0_XENLA|nr:hypothetical protein XELAEV_18018830mg [Xenopus laevis]